MPTWIPATTPAVGDKIPVAFPNAFGAWTAYTPTLTQSATLTKTVTRATYTQIVKTVIGAANLAITSSGTASNAIVVGLPVAAAVSAGLSVGSFWYSAAGTNYSGDAVLTTSTTVSLISTGGTNYFGVNPAVTAVSGHTITINFSYEAA